jgi:transposase-like protein
VKEYMVSVVPQLSGLWHEDETMFQCEGRSIWFWEMIDKDTKFMVASHISGTRTSEDTVSVFKKGFERSKVRPRAVFVDGSFVYSSAFNKVSAHLCEVLIYSFLFLCLLFYLVILLAALMKGTHLFDH